MKKDSIKMVSIALLVLGIGLAFWGYQMSGGFGSRVSLAITGSHSDKVMMLYIGGAVSFVAGLYLFITKK